MKKNSRFLPSFVISAAIVLIAVCFGISMRIIEIYAKEDCFTSIEESTEQMATMFFHTMEQHQIQLTLFADILATNDSNPKEILLEYMNNFCNTQNFSAVCVHRRDGTHEYFGQHPHGEVMLPDFDSEVKRLPYTSDVYSLGQLRKDNYVYIAVPVVRDGDTVAILYGYITLASFPKMVSSTAYEGKCQYYIVDGNNGNFLMDEYRRFDRVGDERPLDNMFDDDVAKWKIKSGYDMAEVRRNIKNGDRGHFVFRFYPEGDWYYTYYTPIEINNWSMQLTIDESTAFATYDEVRKSALIFTLLAMLFSMSAIVVLMVDGAKMRRKDKENLEKSAYINDVQAALISAHNNPDFVQQALKIIAVDSQAETVLLLNFSNRMISDAYYWPSKDRPVAMALTGLDICCTFPGIYDVLISDESLYIDDNVIQQRLSQTARELFRDMLVSNMLIVPIMDNSGGLKAAIATVNIPEESNRPDRLECLTRDFFLAITNLESYNIIKNMGTFDYLTGVKNRNSYETELETYSTAETERLWCIYMDVNGLHEINNTYGHKAGDRMLCAVAEVARRAFGKDHTYRIGGDEFLAFAMDCSDEEIAHRRQMMLSTIEGQGYYVSLGVKCAMKNVGSRFDVESLVAEAEAAMYRDKKAFYESKHLSNSRHYTEQ